MARMETPKPRTLEVAADVFAVLLPSILLILAFAGLIPSGRLITTGAITLFFLGTTIGNFIRK